MIVIKGNLTITRQAQISNSSETSSDKNNIVAYADLNTFDITNATVIVGDTIIDKLDDIKILVTGEVVKEGCV